MKNKTGFTLAEILISLTIIGVTAALTIPAFVESSKKQIWGNSLSSAITNWESAMNTMIIKEGVDSLLQTNAWMNIDENANEVLDSSTGDDVIKHFSTSVSSILRTTNYHKNIDSYYSPETIKKMNTDGSVGETYTENLNHIGFETNRKITYWVSLAKGPEISYDDSMEKGTPLTQNIGEVIIDINGNEKPNIIGKDIFKFYLNPDGNLFPVGSAATDLYEESGVWTDENSYFSCIDGKINIGWGCTARLIEENFKINY